MNNSDEKSTPVPIKCHVEDPPIVPLAKVGVHAPVPSHGMTAVWSGGAIEKLMEMSRRLEAEQEANILDREVNENQRQATNRRL